MMGPYWYGWGGGWMVIGWLMVVAFWVLVVAAGMAAATKWAAGHGAGSREDGPEAPVDILRRRYAKGELTKEQFETLRRDVA